MSDTQLPRPKAHSAEECPMCEAMGVVKQCDYCIIKPGRYGEGLYHEADCPRISGRHGLTKAIPDPKGWPEAKAEEVREAAWDACQAYWDFLDAEDDDLDGLRDAFTALGAGVGFDWRDVSDLPAEARKARQFGRPAV